MQKPLKSHSAAGAGEFPNTLSKRRRTPRPRPTAINEPNRRGTRRRTTSAGSMGSRFRWARLDGDGRIGTCLRMNKDNRIILLKLLNSLKPATASCTSRPSSFIELKILLLKTMEILLTKGECSSRISKMKIAQIASTVDHVTREAKLKSCDLYCDMKYSLPFLTFTNSPADLDNRQESSETTSTISSDSLTQSSIVDITMDGKISKSNELQKPKMALLDLYSACGAMSTGVCFEAAFAVVNFVTRWAVDLNAYACKSSKKNHPETKVRNEAAEDFLKLLKE